MPSQMEMSRIPNAIFTMIALSSSRGAASHFDYTGTPDCSQDNRYNGIKLPGLEERAPTLRRRPVWELLFPDYLRGSLEGGTRPLMRR